MTEQKPLLTRATPALLIAGSLGGVGAIMVGLLSLAPTVDDGSVRAPVVAQEQPSTLEFQNARARSSCRRASGPAARTCRSPRPASTRRPPLAAAPVVAPIPPVKTQAAKVKAEPLRIRIPKIKVNAPVGAVTVSKRRSGHAAADASPASPGGTGTARSPASSAPR